NGDAHLDAAEHRIGLENRRIAFHHGVAQIDLEAAENRIHVAALKIEGVDLAFAAAENRVLVQHAGCVFALAPAAKMSAAGRSDIKPATPKHRAVEQHQDARTDEDQRPEIVDWHV